VTFVVIYRTNVTGRTAYSMFFLGRNYVSSLLCSLKSGKPTKPKEHTTFGKKLAFYQPWLQ